MPPVERLLWIDTESTGLLADRPVPTALEVSWAITDPSGWHFYKPLSHRFTLLPLESTPAPHPDRTYALRFPQLPADPDGDGEVEWHRWAPAIPGRGTVEARVEHGPGEAVRAMHRDNRLAREWATYHASEHHDAAGRPGLITDWRVLQDLLLTDLIESGWSNLERGQAVIAGGGVSHYEHRFLNVMCPEVFGDPRMHYSTGADVSTVLRTLRCRTSDHGPAFPLEGEEDSGLTEQPGEPFPGKADDLLRWARSSYGRSYIRDAGWSGIPVSHRPDRWSASDTDAAAWAALDQDNHRAAPGIARAIMAHRLLPDALRAYLADYAYSRCDLDPR